MPPTKHKLSLRDLAQAAIDLTATEIVKGIGIVVSVAFPIVGSILCGAWWLSSEFTKAQNKLDTTADSVAEIAAKLTTREADATVLRDRLTRVEDSVAWCCKPLTPAKATGAQGPIMTRSTSVAGVR